MVRFDQSHRTKYGASQCNGQECTNNITFLTVFFRIVNREAYV